MSETPASGLQAGLTKYMWVLSIWFRSSSNCITVKLLSLAYFGQEGGLPLYPGITSLSYCWRTALGQGNALFITLALKENRFHEFNTLMLNYMFEYHKVYTRSTDSYHSIHMHYKSQRSFCVLVSISTKNSVKVMHRFVASLECCVSWQMWSSQMHTCILDC